MLDVIRDLQITLGRTIEHDGAAATVWTIEGTWDGKLGRPTASETPVRFEGTDVFEVGDSQLQRVRRSFDQLAVAEALRLQTIVEPYSDGAMTFGHSLRRWVSKEKPGAVGMTWLLARDETEKLTITARARDIISHFHEVSGFIGIVTGFAGRTASRSPPGRQRRRCASPPTQVLKRGNARLSRRRPVSHP
jgi:hypothetical protein